MDRSELALGQHRCEFRRSLREGAAGSSKAVTAIRSAPEWDLVICDEAHLYNEVTEYVREEMNRAERFVETGEGKRKVNVGFALMVLQRRLASSPEAIFQPLKRRHEKLLSKLREQRLVDSATAAATIEELEKEIERLKELKELARGVVRSGNDAKWTELDSVLDDPLMTDDAGHRRKLVIFSEFKDTLSYLVYSRRQEGPQPRSDPARPGREQGRGARPHRGPAHRRHLDPRAGAGAGHPCRRSKLG